MSRREAWIWVALITISVTIVSGPLSTGAVLIAVYMMVASESRG